MKFEHFFDRSILSFGFCQIPSAYLCLHLSLTLYLATYIYCTVHCFELRAEFFPTYYCNKGSEAVGL